MFTKSVKFLAIMRLLCSNNNIKNLLQMKPLKNRIIILPIGAEKYHQIIDNKILFRKVLSALIEKYPEIFPKEIRLGYRFIGYSKRDIKITIPRRYIRIKTPFNSYEDYLVHPCFIMPYLKGITTEVSVGLRLRKYNLPYDMIAVTHGKNAMYWYRAEIALSQYNIVGTTIKSKEFLPKDLLMDEHHTKLFKDKIYACTIVGSDCFLGAGISPTMQYKDLKIAYNYFKMEVKKIDPNYSPDSINIDGYKSTTKVVQNLFPTAGILRCFLHSFIKIRSCGTKAYDLYFAQIAKRVWGCYYAKTKQSFSQRISHLEQWTLRFVPTSPFKQSILKLCKKKRIYASL